MHRPAGLRSRLEPSASRHALMSPITLMSGMSGRADQALAQSATEMGGASYPRRRHSLIHHDAAVEPRCQLFASRVAGLHPEPDQFGGPIQSECDERTDHDAPLHGRRERKAK